MPIILFSLIFILVLIFIAEPLIRGKQKISASREPSQLLEEKGRIYSLLMELDEDFQSGKLSEEDYNRLRNQYLEQAISIVKKIEEAPKARREEISSVEKKMDQLIKKEKKRRKKKKKG
jgi:hypothetical protein